MKYAINGDSIFLEDPVCYQDYINAGNYNLCESLRGLYLHKVEPFSFNHIVYGVEDKFISRVVKTFNALDKSTGILLNGLKGTGKTVTAKKIAIESKLPIILVSKAFGGLTNFINNLPQSCAIFIDEYEKVFDKSDMLLSVMDGAYSSSHKHLFILTTNEPYISQSMLARPGRIRYMKNFSDTSLEIIEMIINDRLVHKHWREHILNVIKSLKSLTIDLVTSLIDEVNIHDDDPAEFIKNFNMPKDYTRYNAYTIINGEKLELISDVDNTSLRENYRYNVYNLKYQDKIVYAQINIKQLQKPMQYSGALLVFNEDGELQEETPCVVKLEEKQYTHYYWRKND